jgi:hypothetical protein
MDLENFLNYYGDREVMAVNGEAFGKRSSLSIRRRVFTEGLSLLEPMTSARSLCRQMPLLTVHGESCRGLVAAAR